MCSAFTPGCGYDNSTFILSGNVYCPNRKCSGKVCLQKKTFQFFRRSNYQCQQCAPVCQVRNNPFEDQTKSFFLSFGQRAHVFEESPKSIEDVIGDVYCPGKFCSNREKCESLGSYVTTPRSIYGCGKCGAWLFVHKVPFMLQEHVKTTQTDKTRFFFARKRWFWHPINNCYLMCHFNQPNIEGKNWVWTTKYKRLLDMCIVPHIERKIVFIFQPIKRLVSTTVKRAKPVTTFWIFFFRTKKPTIMVLGGDGTHCFVWKTSRDCNKTFSIFEENVLPITIKHTGTWGAKKGKKQSLYGIIVSTPHWLIQLTKKSSTLSVYTNPV